MSPIFSNKPNEPIHSKDGRTIWNSRSCAVAIHVMAVDKQFESPHILSVQRGPSSPDFVDWFCLPCGYIDWNETSHQAARREAWEETGIDLFSLSMSDGCSVLYSDITDVETQSPWSVNSSPLANKQNITLHHGVLISVDRLPKVGIENNERPGEIREVKWIPLQNFIGHRSLRDFVQSKSSLCEGKYPICFNHDKAVWEFTKQIVYNKLLQHVRSLQDVGVPVGTPEWFMRLDSNSRNSLDMASVVEYM